MIEFSVGIFRELSEIIFLDRKIVSNRKGTNNMISRRST
jgi:hypothetical protein